jgi:hypothetical protein
MFPHVRVGVVVGSYGSRGVVPGVSESARGRLLVLPAEAEAEGGTGVALVLCRNSQSCSSSCAVARSLGSMTRQRERKSQHSGDTCGGMGGGVLEVATWNSAERLFVNSGHGGFPVAVQATF